MGDFTKNNKVIDQKHKARILCVEALFQYDYRLDNQEELISLSWLKGSNPPTPQTLEYFQFLLKGTFNHLTEIDDTIATFAQKNTVETMMKIDRAILRFATFSLLFETEMQGAIIIDEAIKITKIYSGIDAYKFINGVLDGIHKKLLSENIRTY